MTHSAITVSAAANVALVKYWGKSSLAGNQPATASLSIGLEDLRTTTRVSLADKDSLETDLDGKAKRRLAAFIDDFRRRFAISQPLKVETSNNFPTAAGLASSASGFAAITLALDAIFDLSLDSSELSKIARSGSGSAARSIYGGYAEMLPTEDAFARSLMPAESWPLDIIVAVISSAAKPTGSTEAMLHTAATSPLYAVWLSSQADDMAEARQAVNDRDFEKLATISEHNCLKMHATIMASRPPLLYWQATTLSVIHLVQQLRAEGMKVFFTIDAGPQVKLVCEPADRPKLHEALASVSDIAQLILTRVGGNPVIERK